MNSSNRDCDALERLRSAIQAAERTAGRMPGCVSLLAVSKGQSAESIAALVACGQRRFAESYLQEALVKQEVLAKMAVNPPLEWHFIGPIQSNKTRKIAETFDWVHSVDRLKIAERLNEQRPESRGVLRVFIEVNVDNSVSKSGVAPEAAAALIAACQALPRLCVVGLMAIPAPGQVDGFARLAALNAQLLAPLPMLSMGMSADFPAAIAAGSTHVRIGTALFGARRVQVPRSPQTH
ncbi:YggS family pyridoxal phosphate-dependent enzyme [Halothiobacillus sp. DCM-1]|uniref:YggS family pyridoxal phosphate-dependent enzyme n=1 Tax=Halothiobacillus sp. DCM-1 TaxID=3112558 RepID=UPI00324B7DD9